MLHRAWLEGRDLDTREHCASRENSEQSWQAKQGVMIQEPRTWKGQTPEGGHQMQRVVHEGDFTRRRRTTCHLGLGNGRTKAVVGPTINGFGGKENGAVVLSQGGSGHHGKGMMGRRGSTGEPTELGNWQNVECGGGKEERSPQGFNLYGWERVA